MAGMDGAKKTIRIQHTCTAVGCGNCHREPGAAPVCRAALNAAWVAPEFSGPADVVARLMAALASPLGFQPDTAGAGVVRALRVQPGEVELQLAVGGLRGAELLDLAFRTLRGLLPDTDIYVSPMH